jgi:hypothetical protein
MEQNKSALQRSKSVISAKCDFFFDSESLVSETIGLEI